MNSVLAALSSFVGGEGGGGRGGGGKTVALESLVCIRFQLLFLCNNYSHINVYLQYTYSHKRTMQIKIIVG